MTPEEQAVRQHLSKDRPYSSACGCMGVMPIDRMLHSGWGYDYTIKVTSFGTRTLDVIRVLRQKFGITLRDAADARDAGEFTADCGYPGMQKEVFYHLQEAGATVQMITTSPNMEPYCPCLMKWVEEVEGVYYQINEYRSPDGIEVTARCVGSKGGPYIL